MRSRKLNHIGWGWMLPLLLIFISLSASSALGSSLVYKNYVIRYDRGWDILCEPYVVQKNDWVLKIFRRKGEIAHQNFRDFLGIFQRLNPHIKDINLIRPGQGIDIPLRKLEHGALPGQASGVVTIPFVTLTDVKKVIKEHSEIYQVQRGDTVSRLIARKYGRYGSNSYEEGVKLFKAANPQVSNIDLIYAGQKLYLPEPTIREQTWYGSMYDREGNLKATLRPQEETPSAPSGPGAEPKAEPRPMPDALQAQTPLSEAADLVGGKLHAKGTLFLPRNQGEDFELDLQRHPMMEIDGNRKLVFSGDRKIMDMPAGAFANTWPDIKPVTIDDQASVQEIVSAVFEALGEEESSSHELSFETKGVQVSVRAKWVRSDEDGRQLCITPIDSIEEQTPESIRRFVEQNGIVIKEILPGGVEPDRTPAVSRRHAVTHILALAPTDQEDFVRHLTRVLGFGYAPDVAIHFPYAGIQVQAYANLISADGNREVFVDFGELYGDALTAITKTGLNVVQIEAEESYEAIAQKILAALDMPFEQNPSFLAANRGPEFNTTLTVLGVLYTHADTKRTLLSPATFHPAVTDLLNRQGIDVVNW